MEKTNRKAILEKLNEAMRVSSKIYAVDHIFLSEEAGNDITISSSTADGIHIILDEIAIQIGNLLSDSIELIDELKEGRA